MKDKIKENMEVVGFEGGHLGVVDCVEGDRIKLKKRDGDHGKQDKHHHYISLDLVNDIQNHKVRLCCDADIDALFEGTGRIDR